MEEYLQATGPVILALPIHVVRKKHDIMSLLASMKTFEGWHGAHFVEQSRHFIVHIDVDNITSLYIYWQGRKDDLCFSLSPHTTV
jgi:hypothetical protein